MLRTLHVLSIALCVSGLTAQVSHFSACLDGGQEVPANASAATGWGVVRFDAATNAVRIFVHTEGIAGTAAHMHIAPAGVNGGVIVPLTPASATDWSGTGTLTAAQAAALTASGTYLNVHTPAFPGGEIRGQVVTSTSMRITAALSGAQEVPPNNSAASGTAICFLHEPDNRLVYVVRTQGLVNVTAAHVHTAPAGVNGSVLFPLVGSAGDYCGVSRRLTPAQLTTLKSAGMYANVHTAAFPGGEIRGQLLVNDGDFFGAMDGSQENPPVVTNAVGEACATVNPDGSITYRMSTSGLTGTAAHFHRAAVGVNGPVVVPMAGGPSVWSGTSAPQSNTNLADLRGGLWYANAHTTANPGGEIRGQMKPAILPAPYGGACDNSDGTISQIGADGFACLGASVDVTLFGAVPSVPIALSLGGSRDQLGAVPLPLSLGFLGSAPCFLLQDLLLTVGGATDARGCARTTINVPLVPALRQGLVFAQWFMVDAGLRASNGLSITMQ